MGFSGRVDRSTGIGSPTPAANLNDVNSTLVTTLTPGPDGRGTSYSELREQSAYGNDSATGTFTNNEWKKRVLNTKGNDPDSIFASDIYDSGSIDIIAGTYRCEVESTYRVTTSGDASFRMKMAVCLGDPSDEADNFILNALHEQASAGSGPDNATPGGGTCIYAGRFVIEDTTEFSVHMQPCGSGGTVTGGTASSPTVAGSLDHTTTEAVEVYTVVRLYREGGPISETEEAQVSSDPLNPLAAPKARPLRPELIIAPTDRRVSSERIVNEEFRPTDKDWVGINTRNAPELLNNREAADALNCDSIGHPQTLERRKGMVKLQAIDTNIVEGGTIYDLRIEHSDGTGYMGLSGLDSGATQIYSEVKQDLIVPPTKLPKFVPDVTLANSSGEINVQIAAITSMSGFEKVRVAWSDTYFPNDYRGSPSKKSDTFEEFDWFGDTAFNGTTTTVAISGETYVTVWLKSHTGWSKAYTGKVTLS